MAFRLHILSIRQSATVQPLIYGTQQHLQNGMMYKNDGIENDFVERS